MTWRLSAALLAILLGWWGVQACNLHNRRISSELDRAAVRR